MHICKLISLLITMSSAVFFDFVDADVRECRAGGDEGSELCVDFEDDGLVVRKAGGGGVDEQAKGCQAVRENADAGGLRCEQGRERV